MLNIKRDSRSRNAYIFPACTQEFDKWIRTQVGTGGHTLSPAVWQGIQTDELNYVFIGGYGELVEWLRTRTDQSVPRPPAAVNEHQVATFVRVHCMHAKPQVLTTFH